MTWTLVLREVLEAGTPHYLALVLILARLAPITFLCPLFGGMSVPGTVRLGVSLSLAMWIHLEGGVEVSTPAAGLAAPIAKELCLGTVVGLISSLPFDAARMGGRFVDLFRGSTAEAILPGIGSKESALSEGLHRWLVSLVAASSLYSVILASVVRSFGWLPLGVWEATQNVIMEVAKLVGVALASGLAIGAPIAVLSLLIDLATGLLSRAVPQLQFTELSAPAKVLGGAVMVWLALGLISERLLQNLEIHADILRSAVTGP